MELKTIPITSKLVEIVITIEGYFSNNHSTRFNERMPS